MDIIELYEMVRSVLDKDRNGSVNIQVFCTIVNQAQIAYIEELLGGLMDKVQRLGPEASGRAMDSIANFWTPPAWKPASGGVIDFSTPGLEYAGLLEMWLNGADPTNCTDPVPIQSRVPFARVSPGKWGPFNESKRYNAPKMETPAFRMSGPTTAEVLPGEISGAWCRYVRMPREVSVTLLPNSVEVDPAGPKVDPEWRAIDMGLTNGGLMGHIVKLLGIREQAPTWQNAGRGALS